MPRTGLRAKRSATGCGCSPSPGRPLTCSASARTASKTRSGKAPLPTPDAQTSWRGCSTSCVETGPRLMEQQQRARLLGHKLRLIAGVQTESSPVAGGAGLLDGDRAWVLVEDDAERGLGMTLAWAVRQRATSAVTVVNERPVAEVLARRATALSFPVEVRYVDGTASLEASPADPPPAGPYEPAPGVEAHLPAAAAAGVEVVPHADGSVSFEVLGLEAGRVTADGKLSVGVGRHDRDAHDELYQGEPNAAALIKTADVLRERRRAGAQSGPRQLSPTGALDPRDARCPAVTRTRIPRGSSPPPTRGRSRRERRPPRGLLSRRRP